MAWEDKPANYKKIEKLLSRTGPERGSMVVLPEMSCTGFSMDAAKIYEAEKGPTEQFYSQLAKNYACCVVAGVVTRAPSGKGLNQSVAFNSQGQLLGRYSKIHPFALGGELKAYDQGKEVVQFQWQNFRCSPFVCYDLRFPEVFRTAVRRGTELFVVIADWPVKRIHHWIGLLQARAIENLAYVVGVNRTGVEPSYQYNGRSIIVDPHGKILADADEQEGIISADIQLNEVTEWRRQFPALQDMHWKD
jgi:omega-amidase